jgi:hypothetical protein
MINEFLTALATGLCVTVAIGIIALFVYWIFGPVYVRCDCGNKCEVSRDGWFYWECDKCGASGKANPF